MAGERRDCSRPNTRLGKVIQRLAGPRRCRVGKRMIAAAVLVAMEGSKGGSKDTADAGIPTLCSQGRSPG
ncbi:Hypothetical predicted protein, partial [Pelobates cultripes]